MSYTERVKKSINKNYVKLIADKIHQKLDQVREERTKSRRRWIWELMQNAKDVENRFGDVIIDIELNDNEFIFKHNGDPFTVDNLTALIQQVSSKPADSSEENTTGKFGTGFITTHLLSEIIKVKGVIHERNEIPKRFKIKLDRSGETSDDLIPSIEEAMEEISNIEDENQFPTHNRYIEEREEQDTDTEFIYPLINQEARKSAKAGLKDLKVTLPPTLIFVEKIKKVQIQNFQLGSIGEFKLSKLESIGDDIRLAEVRYTDKTKKEISRINFLLFDTNEISLAAKIDNTSKYKLQEIDSNQPFLYRDFPLIGTEKFHLPFVVNGNHLEPTEKRDGVFLNSNTSKSKHNKKIIEEVFEASKKFVKALIQRGAKNLYQVALSRLPDYNFESTTKEWYKKVQSDYRAFLLKKEIVETEKGKNTLGSVLIPYQSQSEDENTLFWELCAPFLGFESVPKKSMLSEWIRAVGPIEEIETWGKNLYFKLEDLFEKLAENETLDNIHLDRNAGFNSTYEWVNAVFTFSYNEKKSELLDDYEVVPNQYGDFYALKDLFEEDKSNPIPDYFLEILKRLGEDWKSKLISRKINFEGLNHQKKGLSDINDQINNYLKDSSNVQGGKLSEFLRQENAQEILVDLIRIIDENSTLNSFQHQLFKLSKQFFHFDEDFITIPNSSKFNFDAALKLTIEWLNRKIAKCHNISNLANKLEVSEEKSIVWLNKYLKLLDSHNEYKRFLKEDNIFPNRYHDLCPFEDLYSYGTEQEPLNEELVNILQNLNGEKDWSKNLLADGIEVRPPKVRDLEELLNEIQKEVKLIRQDEELPMHKEVLMDFIDWGEDNPDVTKKYFPEFEEFADRAFYNLVLENNPQRRNIIDLLKDRDKIEAVTRLTNTDADLNKLSEIATISHKLGDMDKILDHAKELLEEKKDFEFKKKIGEIVEEVFLETLKEEGIEANVRYQGYGAYDFVFSSNENDEKFYVELKSHASNTNRPIKMAISQAKFAVQQPDCFALCVIERPLNENKLSKDYIKNNLKYKSQIEKVLKETVDDYKVFKYLKEKNDYANIDYELRDKVKVAIDHDYIDSEYKPFYELVKIIRQKIFKFGLS